jgi:uncharacterized C2H2 Zn-finger protein
MYGRYGADQLYIALFVLYFVVLVINMFTRSWIVDVLMWAILVWLIFRTFSRNIYKRQRENEIFLKFWNPIQSEFSLFFRRIREIRTHRFRKCPHCKAVLRLPRKRGKNTVRCPRCQTRFQVRVFF